ncbi:helix-turn-helix transcriptional regulator [Paenibacillus anseongense]|uniref:helix-turn-helix domain-containing protein n=1 Tax=Paenibacillus anseongense TaxID=2682845 RepID=UPI002DB69094|nr:helix-turn-helix transcriptional regulator [Paenibacillus anseongense]MEC0265161.1 helix-turn-helix transcriptional regulator [Paenibacillus anseongense]
MQTNNLKQIRKLRKFTQQQLADELKVSKQVISMWENNPNEKIPPDRVKQLADVLKVTQAEIINATVDEESITLTNLTEQVHSLVNQLNSLDNKDEQLKVLEKLNSLTGLDMNSHINQINEFLDDFRYDDPSKIEKLSDFSRILSKGSSSNIDLGNLLNLLEFHNEEQMNFLYKIVMFLQYFRPKQMTVVVDNEWLDVMDETDSKQLIALFEKYSK